MPAARREFADLEAFAGRPLAAWDVAYYADKLQHERHAVSEEALRPWFPLPRVLAGLFEIATRLYGIRIAEQSGVAVWHPDVRFFEIHDAAGGRIGGRQSRRPATRASARAAGAWMDEVTVGRKHRASSVRPCRSRPWSAISRRPRRARPRS